MKTLQELQEIRERVRAVAAERAAGGGDTKVIVGMATCGIAAGARETLTALNDETAKRGLKNVSVKQTGCIGMCKYEPIVEVFAPGREKVTYILVDPVKARRIVGEHIAAGGNPITEFLYKE
jgi:NADP-reducing hydrogenase subunit HndB